MVGFSFSRLNLLNDVGGQQIGEEVFLLSSATITSGCCSWALQSRSLTAISSCTSLRKRPLLLADSGQR